MCCYVQLAVLSRAVVNVAVLKLAADGPAPEVGLGYAGAAAGAVSVQAAQL